MSEQEQPYSEWLAECLRYISFGYGLNQADSVRVLRELRQRDEELERLRAQVAELEGVNKAWLDDWSC